MKQSAESNMKRHKQFINLSFEQSVKELNLKPISEKLMLLLLQARQVQKCFGGVGGEGG